MSGSCIAGRVAMAGRFVVGHREGRHRLYEN